MVDSGLGIYACTQGWIDVCMCMGMQIYIYIYIYYDNPLEYRQQRNGCRWAHIIVPRQADRAVDGLSMPGRALNTRF